VSTGGIAFGAGASYTTGLAYTHISFCYGPEYKSLVSPQDAARIREAGGIEKCKVIRHPVDPPVENVAIPRDAFLGLN
jgi:hypothetical protein